MSQTNKKLNRQAPEVTSGVSCGNLPAAEAQRVRELIAGRHSKSALDVAKALHKSCGTAESEALILDAYQCRIEDLLELGMAIEAKALLKMVSERFPASRLRLMGLQREICARDGRLDEVVEPLRDPNLPVEIRSQIEVFIRRRVYDLRALAAASSLPPEHPLREAAAALTSALQAVTRGQVDDQVLALPQVSRRSPLAPWKALVRAVAFFYRREDDACRKWLHAIPDDSVPASLIPPLKAMLGMKVASELKPAEQRLMAATGGSSAALHPALAVLQKALAAKKQKPLLEAARAAVAACDQCRPEIRERLRQHITIRCLAQGISRPAINSAIGAPREDAYFYRLLATSSGHNSEWHSRADAVLTWEQFRREAIKEKWFAADSLEDGVLSLHMAQMAEHEPPDLLDELIFGAPRRNRRNAAPGSQDLLSPDALYERACRADPNSDAFQMWLNWAAKHRSWKVADNVAELWRAARAGDIKPLLYLTESTEKRGAYKKSLKYLEDAEELDRLNPDVRRTKLRLLLSAAMRHLRQGKAHLVRTEIERIEALPEVREGNVSALAACLRRTCAALEQDFVTMREQDQELLKLLGGIVPAYVLTNGLVEAANLESRVPVPPLDASGVLAADLLAGAAGACVLADWAGIPLALPVGWDEHLMAALNQPNFTVDIPQLLVLGEAALRSQAERLAYALSAAGLLDGGAAEARFLFLRGRSLPGWAYGRREGCFAAALELARRERNTELAGKILDQLRGPTGQISGFGVMDDPNVASRPMPPELLNQILAEERAEKQFPIAGRSRPPEYLSKLGPTTCDCPNCRARRGDRVNDHAADEDFDLDDDEAAFADFDEAFTEFVEFLGTLPARKARKVTKAIARGDPPEIAAPRILGNALPEPSPPSPRNAKKTGVSVPRPEQGNLF